jgi:glycogen debranching enzyme
MLDFAVCEPTQMEPVGVTQVPEFPSLPLDTAGLSAPLRLFALKEGDTFLVMHASGDVHGEGDGLFHNDTRILSSLRLWLGGKAPSLLGASVAQDNVFFTANLTNRPLPPLGGNSTPEGVIHLERKRFLWDARLYERISFHNFADFPATIPLTLTFEADFRDMFEVRGVSRQSRGNIVTPEASADSVVLQYQGLDNLIRRCSLTFSEPPAQLGPNRADFLLTLDEGGRREIYVEIGPDATEAASQTRFRAAAAAAKRCVRAILHRSAMLRTSGRIFNEWIDKSRADLALLTTELPTGPYPYAGIPWFSTPFGRDAIVTALQVLWLDPSLARGVLTFLARNQARETSRFQDSAPGKILHETRKGEMTALRELPFGKYYGGVDTTPLFVMLAGAYAARTADMALIDELWPALHAAMGWIEGEGDSNGDGFVDYARGEQSGLANQGWKDSHDSVFHADGSEARGPIALIEVQGYVFAAMRAMAKLAGWRGAETESAIWLARAEALRQAVEKRFWLEDLGYYALAVDGDGVPCAVRGSNAGHLLFTGLPAPDRAGRVSAQLLAAHFNSGWGIRTLASGEARFNPMSYHNGSIWPHDTALCAAGIARYGDREGVVQLMSGMFEAAVKFEMRLPELFCGFNRVAGESPIAYPVACLPQAWSSGAVFMMLQACLGVRVDPWRGEVHVDRPRLPAGIDRLTISRLAVGQATIDLTFQRIGERVVAFPEGKAPGAVPVLLHV